MYNNRIMFITHKGKRILTLDYSKLRPEEIQEMIEEVTKVMLNEPEHSILGVGNFEDMHFSAAVVGAFTKMNTVTEKYIKASAMIGVKGLVKIMYDGFLKLSKFDAKTFYTRDEALDWLAER